MRLPVLVDKGELRCRFCRDWGQEHERGQRRLDAGRDSGNSYRVALLIVVALSKDGESTHEEHEHS